MSHCANVAKQWVAALAVVAFLVIALIVIVGNLGAQTTCNVKTVRGFWEAQERTAPIHDLQLYEGPGRVAGTLNNKFTCPEGTFGQCSLHLYCYDDKSLELKGVRQRTTHEWYLAVQGKLGAFSISTPRRASNHLSTIREIIHDVFFGTANQKLSTYSTHRS